MAPDPTSAAIDDVFDIFNLDDDDDDPFRELDTTLKAIPEPVVTKRKATDDSDNEDLLGVNEEIKVVKKRKPLPKLDENRLLSQQGIPKLRSGFQTKLLPRLKTSNGRKGYEFDDVAKMLQFYQLWLDNLYPRAKFKDGLAMIEKVGHGKRMQIMRKTWIDQGKRKGGDYMDEEDGTGVLSPAEPTDAQAITTETTTTAEERPQSNTKTNNPSNSIFGNGTTTHPSAIQDDDDIDALFLPETNPRRRQTPTPSIPDDEDDLDALLAEHDMAAAAQNKSHPPPSKPSTSTTRPKPNHQPHPDSDPEDDLDALLAEAEADSESYQPAPQPAAAAAAAVTSSPTLPRSPAVTSPSPPLPAKQTDTEAEPVEEASTPDLIFSSSQVEDPECVDVDVDGI